MALKGLRVLVVEDEALIAMMIEDMLQDMGCVVVGSAATANEAQSLVAQGGFDIALLDMNLGGVKGDGVANALAAANIPFVLASGYGLAGVPPHLQKRPILPKPFLTSDLQRSILAALATLDAGAS